MKLKEIFDIRDFMSLISSESSLEPLILKKEEVPDENPRKYGSYPFLVPEEKEIRHNLVWPDNGLNGKEPLAIGDLCSESTEENGGITEEAEILGRVDAQAEDELETGIFFFQDISHLRSLYK